MEIQDKHLRDIAKFTKELTLNYQRPTLSVRETEKGEYYKQVYNFRNNHLQIESCEGLIFDGFIKYINDLKELYGWLNIKNIAQKE